MKLIQYKSFITLKCITRKGIPHERIRAVAGTDDIPEFISDAIIDYLNNTSNYNKIFK